VSTSCYTLSPGILIEALCCNVCGHRTESASDSPSKWLICARCGNVEFVRKPQWVQAPAQVWTPPDVEEPEPELEKPRGQTRLGSAIEVALNIVVGFSVNWFANLLILPLYGFQVTGGQAFSMGLIFTVIAIVRGYVLRRVFNRIRSLHHE
jgi:hypothetical protein